MRYWITHGTSAVLRSPVIMVSVSVRSEEHTSELQSQSNLVCRLLLEKKKNGTNNIVGFGGAARVETACPFRSRTATWADLRSSAIAVAGEAWLTLLLGGPTRV